ncbi:MAG: stage V sporulation protein AB [Lachnospiraceae bacterium]|nr:stage V sporulation protein AB [Lachnospiraceae bacterium]
MFHDILLSIVGLTGGISIAGGIFAAITTVGVIPQIAEVTRTQKYVKSYETAVILGGIIGNIIIIFKFNPFLPVWFMAIFGLGSGIFVGCLATALAEALNVTTVFTRRLRLHTGIQWVILSLALGKVIGSLIYFFRQYKQ